MYVGITNTLAPTRLSSRLRPRRQPASRLCQRREQSGRFSKVREQRNAPCVGCADAGYERLLPYAELVARVRQKQEESRVSAPLTAVRGLWKGRGWMRFACSLRSGEEDEWRSDGPAIITSHSTSNSGSSCEFLKKRLMSPSGAL